MKHVSESNYEEILRKPSVIIIGMFRKKSDEMVHLQILTIIRYRKQIIIKFSGSLNLNKHDKIIFFKKNVSETRVFPRIIFKISYLKFSSEKKSSPLYSFILTFT